MAGYTSLLLRIVADGALDQETYTELRHALTNPTPAQAMWAAQLIANIYGLDQDGYTKVHHYLSISDYVKLDASIPTSPVSAAPGQTDTAINTTGFSGTATSSSVNGSRFEVPGAAAEHAKAAAAMESRQAKAAFYTTYGNRDVANSWVNMDVDQLWAASQGEPEAWAAIQRQLDFEAQWAAAAQEHWGQQVSINGEVYLIDSLKAPNTRTWNTDAGLPPKTEGLTFEAMQKFLSAGGTIEEWNAKWESTLTSPAPSSMLADFMAYVAQGGTWEDWKRERGDAVATDATHNAPSPEQRDYMLFVKNNGAWASGYADQQARYAAAGGEDAYWAQFAAPAAASGANASKTPKLNYTLANAPTPSLVIPEAASAAAKDTIAEVLDELSRAQAAEGVAALSTTNLPGYRPTSQRSLKLIPRSIR